MIGAKVFFYSLRQYFHIIIIIIVIINIIIIVIITIIFIVVVASSIWQFDLKKFWLLLWLSKSLILC